MVGIVSARRAALRSDAVEEEEEEGAAAGVRGAEEEEEEEEEAWVGGARCGRCRRGRGGARGGEMRDGGFMDVLVDTGEENREAISRKGGRWASEGLRGGKKRRRRRRRKVTKKRKRSISSLLR